MGLFKGVNASRLRSGFYGVLAVIVAVGIAIESAGGLGSLSVVQILVIIASVIGGGTSGYHVPSASYLVDHNKAGAATSISLADAIGRIEQEPPGTRVAIASKIHSDAS